MVQLGLARRAGESRLAGRVGCRTSGSRSTQLVEVLSQVASCTLEYLDQTRVQMVETFQSMNLAATTAVRTGEKELGKPVVEAQRHSGCSWDMPVVSRPFVENVRVGRWCQAKRAELVCRE